MARVHRIHLTVALLLALHSALAVHALHQQSITVDEACHVPAGLSQWQTGRFSAYRVNPPLMRLVSTMPVMVASPVFDGRTFSDSPGRNMGIDVARHFAHNNVDRYRHLFFLARYPIVVFSVIGGWYVFGWSQKLFGSEAGLFAVTLWCFSPNILAHAQLATCDIGATVTGFVATYYFWRNLGRPGWGRGIGCGILLGLAQLAKFTLLALYIIWPLMWLLDLITMSESRLSVLRAGDPTEFRAARLWIRAAAQCTLIYLLSIVVINAGYGFKDSFRPLGEFEFLSRVFTGPQGHNRYRDSAVARVPVPLPEQYVLGIDAQSRDLERGLPAYLRGSLRRSGWWYYYLYALAIKVPLGVWMLVAVAGTLALRRPSHFFKHLQLLAPILLILVLVSSQTGVQYLRYALPLFPFLFVFASSSAVLLQHRSWVLKLIPVIALILTTGSSMRVHPHHLSYFNELVGGPDHGGQHLLASDMDWGQDLHFLQRWSQAHPNARPLMLAYHHLVVDPQLVGLQYDLPPPAPPSGMKVPPFLSDQFGPVEGWQAVSVSLVYGLALNMVPDGHGGWRHVQSHQYTYFQHFQPIAKAGYSIFIYHITKAEADRVRRRLGLEPLPEPPSRGEPWLLSGK